jgi:hypothetical protein
MPRTLHKTGVIKQQPLLLLLLCPVSKAELQPTTLNAPSCTRLHGPVLCTSTFNLACRIIIVVAAIVVVCIIRVHTLLLLRLPSRLPIPLLRVVTTTATATGAAALANTPNRTNPSVAHQRANQRRNIHWHPSRSCSSLRALHLRTVALHASHEFLQPPTATATAIATHILLRQQPIQCSAEQRVLILLLLVLLKRGLLGGVCRRRHGACVAACLIHNTTAMCGLRDPARLLQQHQRLSAILSLPARRKVLQGTRGVDSGYATSARLPHP